MISACSVCARHAEDYIADVCFDCARALVGLRGVSPGGTRFEPNIKGWRIDAGHPGFVVGICVTSAKRQSPPPPLWKFWCRSYVRKP